ncbi:hypothetical protein UVI_02027150 [Ustilaginoidea virens]|uniref:Cytochrome b5 heme-binding domain-containing protein n=1 Tax=Ustilaginoidea virens TaxID=1159556 RepID=A0A1B5L5X4_USTVR|nr:hypothetical protein UVI_02027150 [Ustilaginoidea virens]
MATTLRFLKDSRLSPEMRAHYHAVSRHAVMIYAMEHVSIEAQRALVILALDELGTSTGPRGWNMLSILAQNVRQLHLGEESSLHLSADESELPSAGPVRKVAIPQPDSWIEDEGRRRLCWMVYLLDRYATIATTTFDFMLDDGKMNRVLPCSYDLFSRNVPVETSVLDQTTGQQGATGYAVNKPENLGSFSYHCQILRTMSKVHDFLKAPVDVTCSAGMARWRGTYRSLDAALNSWLQSLPSEYSRISALCHSDPASRVANWFMLHSAYVTAVVRLHSSAAYPSVRSPISAPSHYAMQRCLSAVQSLRDITQDVFEANGLDLVGPPFAFSLWTAARLLIVHAATMGGPVDAKIDFFIEILGHVGKYWQVAISYARILARVVQRARRGEMGLGAMRSKILRWLALSPAMAPPAKTFTRAEVRQHTAEDSLWCIIDSIVYDVSDFVAIHPGGESVLRQVAGQDATTAFYNLHRQEVLTQHADLAVGTVEGETPQVLVPRPGDLSPVPYAEPLWLARPFRSPYYGDSHRRLQRAMRAFTDEHLLPEARACESTGRPVSQPVIDLMSRKGVLHMRLGPGRHLHGVALLDGAVRGDEFDHFHDLVVAQELARTMARGFQDGNMAGMTIGLPAVLNFARDDAWGRAVADAVFSGRKKLCLAITEAFAGLAKMIALVEANHSWLESVTYQMCSMPYKLQAQHLAGPIGLLKMSTTRAAHDIADEAVQIWGGRALTQTGMGKHIEMFRRTYAFDSVLGGAEQILGDLGVRQAVKNFPKAVL